MISVWVLLALAFGLVAAAAGVLLVGGRHDARRAGGSTEAEPTAAARDAPLWIGDGPGDWPGPSEEASSRRDR